MVEEKKADGCYAYAYSSATSLAPVTLLFQEKLYKLRKIDEKDKHFLFPASQQPIFDSFFFDSFLFMHDSDHIFLYIYFKKQRHCKT